MKYLNTIAILTLCFQLSLAQTSVPKSVNKKIEGEWIMLEKDNERAIGPCLYGGEDIGIKFVSILNDGQTYGLYLASFKTENGFACPILVSEATVSSTTISGKSTGPCAAEDKILPFKFVYKYDSSNDQFVIVYKTKEFRYKRYTFN